MKKKLIFMFDFVALMIALGSVISWAYVFFRIKRETTFYLIQHPYFSHYLYEDIIPILNAELTLSVVGSFIFFIFVVKYLFGGKKDDS